MCWRVSSRGRFQRNGGDQSRRHGLVACSRFSRQPQCYNSRPKGLPRSEKQFSAIPSSSAAAPSSTTFETHHVQRSRTGQINDSREPKKLTSGAKVLSGPVGTTEVVPFPKPSIRQVLALPTKARKRGTNCLRQEAGAPHLDGVLYDGGIPGIRGAPTSGSQDTPEMPGFRNRRDRLRVASELKECHANSALQP